MRRRPVFSQIGLEKISFSGFLPEKDISLAERQENIIFFARIPKKGYFRSYSPLASRNAAQPTTVFRSPSRNANLQALYFPQTASETCNQQKELSDRWIDKQAEGVLKLQELKQSLSAAQRGRQDDIHSAGTSRE